MITNEPVRVGVKECARKLSLSRSTVIREIEAGEIPAIRVGKKKIYKVLPSDLNAYIEARKTASHCAPCLETALN